jgi:2-polyprenyl-6-methoxyphenol hydroxylase-like FAD-dependent oxidoreductase
MGPVSDGTPLQTRCCVVGGGPAGMMFAFLLARAGVDVVVLEKHGDFLRDFRGDTVHPSTLELMYELGLLKDFLERPHDEIAHLTAWVGDAQFRIGDFTHLPTHCKFVALMPQWDFLNFLVERAKRYELTDWEQIKLLTVKVDRLKRWSRPGLLCIGDAAHAMSPIGGVGINLAIQDAVAAANSLAEPLRKRSVIDTDLARVQNRREFPTRATQRLQMAIQNNVVKRVLGSSQTTPPRILKLVDRWPILQRIPARLLGLGFRREHIRTPESSQTQS